MEQPVPLTPSQTIKLERMKRAIEKVKLDLRSKASKVEKLDESVRMLIPTHVMNKVDALVIEMQAKSDQIALACEQNSAPTKVTIFINSILEVKKRGEALKKSVQLQMSDAVSYA